MITLLYCSDRSMFPCTILDTCSRSVVSNQVLGCLLQYYSTKQLAVFGATGSPASGALAIFYPNVTLAVRIIFPQQA